MIRYFGLLFFCFSAINGFAITDTSFVQGTDLAYVNQIITVQAYEEYITGKMIEIGRDTVDSTGYFCVVLPLNETRFVQVPLGGYNGLFFVEPGKEYEIALPDFKEKTFGDMLNPYFQPVDIYLGIKNADETDLNYRIEEFDIIYNEYLEKNYTDIFKKQHEADVDTVIVNIEKLYDTVLNAYFNDYRKYRYAWLRYVSYMRNNAYVAKEYFNDMPIQYQNVGYMNLFNQLFSDYLTYYMNKREGERIYSDVALAKSPAMAKESLSNNMALIRDSIQELVLLKGLHDAVYSNEYPLSSVLITLDSIAGFSKIAEHKQIAINIKQKATKARSGYEAYNFELRDANGVFRKRSDYLANYVYLNFCSIESFPCQQDLQLLKELHEKYKTEFRIVSISIDEDFEKARGYFKARGYDWMLLSYKDGKQVLDEYKVKAYPTYYLISPKGKFVMSPAPAPGENFEYLFFRYMQSAKRNELRKQNR